MRYVKKGLTTILLLYLCIGAGIFFTQKLFLLHPVPINRTAVFDIKQPYIEHSFNWLQQRNFSVLQFTTTHKKGLVLYLHGNKKNAERYALYTTIFTKHGYEVWMPDYPEFGKTEGEATEENLYKAALLAYDSMVATTDTLPIIIYGKSLGSGLANYVATKRTCKAVILETPYYSIPSLFKDWVFIYPMQYLSTYNIPSYTYFVQANKPTTIFHGTNDWVIPYRNAKRFMPILKPTDTFITIKAANHTNINQHNIYLHYMDAYLSK
jgi:uncharacterized protein